jgi:hypothetical protein
MYPGNKDRVKRLDEFNNDCALFVSEAIEYRSQIEAELEEANKAIERAYKKYVPDYKAKLVEQKFEIGVTDHVINISECIAGILALPVAYVAWRWAVSTFLVSSGRVSAHFLALEGPTAVIRAQLGRVARFGTGVGAAIVIAIAFESVVDAITGDLQRKQLQRALNEAPPFRIDLKRVNIILNELKELLKSIILTFDVSVKSMEKAGIDITKELLDNLANNLTQEKINKIKDITKTFAYNNLKRLDERRGSWTKEDGDVSEFLTQVNEVTITFDADGGAPVNPPCIKVGEWSEVGILPVAQKTDKRFDGWFYKKNGKGEELKKGDLVAQDFTVFAKWV